MTDLLAFVIKLVTVLAWLSLFVPERGRKPEREVVRTGYYVSGIFEKAR